jgi:hypothetical protein
VINWSSRYSTALSATVVGGALRNPGTALVYDLKLVVKIYDAAGGLLATSDAIFGTTSLPAGGTTTWEARFPGLYTVADAKFEASAKKLELATPPSSESAAAPAPTPTTTLVPVGDPSQPRRLEVVGWQPEIENDTNTLSLVGDLANRGTEVAYDVRLGVTLLAADGTTISSTNALLGGTTLQPGQSTNFRVSFPGVDAYENIRFDARHSARTAVTRTVRAPGGA